MEAESHLSDDVLRQALDAAPDGILIVDGAGVIVYVNPMVEHLFDYGRDELVGRSVDLLLPESLRAGHAERRSEYAVLPRSRSMGTGLDLRGRRQSGSEFPVEISLSPLHAETELLVVVMIRDVTERRAADDELHHAHEVLALVDDRERIARDLHDTVIQRLFAVGLSLQAALTRAASGPAHDRMELAIDEIDLTIRDIRSSIFALQTRRPLAASLRDDIVAVAREAARALGFEPSVGFDGPVDSVTTDDIRANIVATLREALSNVTRHAHASSVTLQVVADAKHVILRISDNGKGIDEVGHAGNGLRNMSERAIALGGTCEISRSSSAGGTQIEWRVPFADERA